jgi:hypothetical protein
MIMGIIINTPTAPPGPVNRSDLPDLILTDGRLAGKKNSTDLKGGVLMIMIIIISNERAV